MLVVVAWLVAVFGIQSVAPKWELITHDGDFSYLPSYLPSVVGERWMSEAFPHQRGRSQIVLALVREQEPITKDDVQIGYDVARRVKNLLGAAQLAAAARLAREEETLRQDRRGAEADTVREQRRTVLQQAEDALQDALQLDTKLADYWDARVAADPSLAPVRPPRLAEIYHNQAQLFRCRGEDELAREWLAQHGFDPLMGARPMARVIQDKVKRPLADELLFGKLVNGGRVSVDVRDDELLVEAFPEPEKLLPATVE